MNDRELVQLLSLGRIAIGVGFLLAPDRANAGWTGRSQDASATTRMAARGLGARDIAIGTGTLVAMEAGAPVRGWVEAAAVADAADAFATLGAFGSLPRWRRWAVLAISAGGAFLYARAASSLE